MRESRSGERDRESAGFRAGASHKVSESEQNVNVGVQGSGFGRVVRELFVSRWEYQSPPCLFKQVLEYL